MKVTTVRLTPDGVFTTDVGYYLGGRFYKRGVPGGRQLVWYTAFIEGLKIGNEVEEETVNLKVPTPMMKWEKNLSDMLPKGEQLVDRAGHPG